MNTITVQTIDSNGEKLEESKLVVEDNEILQVIIPETMSLERALHLHNYIKSTFEDKSKVMSIPENVKFKVIKVG